MSDIDYIRLDVDFTLDDTKWCTVSYRFDAHTESKLLNAVSILQSVIALNFVLYYPYLTFDSDYMDIKDNGYGVFDWARVTAFKSFDVYHDGTEEETTYSITQEV